MIEKIADDLIGQMTEARLIDKEMEARPFTVRENARCQTFPDEWQFCGSVQSQYKQVGNAVPVNLAYEIGLEIHKSLEGVK